MRLHASRTVHEAGFSKTAKPFAYRNVCRKAIKETGRGEREGGESGRDRRTEVSSGVGAALTVSNVHGIRLNADVPVVAVKSGHNGSETRGQPHHFSVHTWRIADEAEPVALEVDGPLKQSLICCHDVTVADRRNQARCAERVGERIPQPCPRLTGTFRVAMCSEPGRFKSALVAAAPLNNHVLPATGTVFSSGASQGPRPACWRSSFLAAWTASAKRAVLKKPAPMKCALVVIVPSDFHRPVVLSHYCAGQRGVAGEVAQAALEPRRQVDGRDGTRPVLRTHYPAATVDCSRAPRSWRMPAHAR